MSVLGGDIAGAVAAVKREMKRETMGDRLDEAELATRLAALNQGAWAQPGRTAGSRTAGAWTLAEGMLHRDLVFPDFDEAFAFMTRVAAIARALDHHPNWSNVYNRVRIDLSTHDAGGVTELDFTMAALIDVEVDRGATPPTAPPQEPNAEPGS